MSGASDPVPQTPVIVRLASPTPQPDSGYGWVDAAPVMSGICFEAAFDAAGQVFVLRSAEDHIRFYDLADNSGLCPRPVERHPFDFSSGDVLVGLWSAGLGCTARHDVVDVARDDIAQTLTIRLRFVVEGDCPYELVRPFWIVIPGVGTYNITIDVD